MHFFILSTLLQSESNAQLFLKKALMSGNPLIKMFLKYRNFVMSGFLKTGRNYVTHMAFLPALKKFLATNKILKTIYSTIT